MAIDKKKKVTIWVLGIIIVLFIAIFALIMININGSKKLSERDRAYFTEAVLLANEAEGTAYDVQDTTYDYFVGDLNPHMRNVEALVFTSNFNYEKKKSNASYENYVVVTFYGLNNLKMNYGIYYNSDYTGKVVTDNNEYILTNNSGTIILSQPLATYSATYEDISHYSILKNGTTYASYDLSTGTILTTSLRSYTCNPLSRKIEVTYNVGEEKKVIDIISESALKYTYTFIGANKVIEANR